MKKLIFILFVLLVLVLGVNAQESTEVAAKKYNVTFPIAELGNCQNYAACRTYCDDVNNREQCVSYAKKKGFYKEPEKNTKRQEMMQSAKTELGCDSEQTCRSFCEQEANFQKCAGFAQKNGLDSKPSGNPRDQKILQKAKEILGCNSENSCKAVCEQEANRDKCSEFAKQTGLGGGVKRVGPGGCNSEESCRSYCEKNPQECGGERRRESEQRNNYEDYCRENPEKCKEFKDRPKDENPPSPEEFCKNNPEKCKEFQEGRGEYERNSNPRPTYAEQISPEEFCKKNPEKCQRFKEEQQNPEQFRKEENRPLEIRQNEIFKPPGIEQKQPEQYRREEGRPEQRPPEEFKREENRPPEVRQNETFRPQENERREEQRPPDERRNEERRPPNEGEFKREEGMKPPEVRGISTAISILQRILNRFFYK